MKKLLIIPLFLAAMAIAPGCSGSDNGQSVQTPNSGSLTEEQRNAAAEKGRRAARELINIDPQDTLGMQNKLMEARAVQSEYVSQKRAAEAEVFDTVFMHTLHAVRPDIYNDINQD
ncbi:MAG: hypothetical protein NC217_08610 [Muribaculaceae bacterium]|nr:hypothetical protein [Muribaculaceae bacterium]